MISPSENLGGAALDTSNKFVVAKTSEGEVILAGLPGMPRITETDAAVLAAWLLKVSGRKREFKQTCRQITKP